MASYFVAALACLSFSQAQTYSATYTPGALPRISEDGQSGTNICVPSDAGPNSMCQSAYFNSPEDFCIWGPQLPNSVIGAIEREAVAYCTTPRHGTRVIPPGTLTSIQALKTDDYYQIVGTGDFTRINIQAGDSGGEMDPHGADGRGNPIGGLMFSSVFSPNGTAEQIHEWSNFQSANQNLQPSKHGQGELLRLRPAVEHIYDVMGCQWNHPGKYDVGTFEACDAALTNPAGIYGGNGPAPYPWRQGASTFHQGEPFTPGGQAPPSSSNCVRASPDYAALALQTGSAAPTPMVSSSSSVPAVGATSRVVAAVSVSTTAAKNGAGSLSAGFWSAGFLSIAGVVVALL